MPQEAYHYHAGADQCLAHPEYRQRPPDRNRSVSPGGYAGLLLRTMFPLTGTTSDIPDPLLLESPHGHGSLLKSDHRSDVVVVSVPDLPERHTDPLLTWM